MSDGSLSSMLKEDPPRIPDPQYLEGAARYCLGNRVYLHETEWLEDGTIIGYIGVSKPKSTQQAALGDPELTFLNYGPLGAVIAEPEGDAYVLHLPDRDGLDRAVRRRERRENDHRAVILPAVKNMLEDRQEMHFDEAGEYGFHELEEGESLDSLDLEGTEWFHLGRAVGMYKMASLAHRVLMQRWNSPYRGERRWESPAYSVIRDRRTSDPLTAMEGDDGG